MCDEAVDDCLTALKFIADDNNNFDEDNTETVIHIRLLAGRNEFEKCKAYEKDISKELMPVA